MVLKAIGKCIDTLPIHDLLSQEESFADTVIFEVDRFHNGWDLSKFGFYLRGVTESGGETESPLTMEIDAQVLRLHWNVTPAFTTEAGTLALDLYGCIYTADADPQTDAPSCTIRYQLPAVQVRGLPESDSILESHSYTDFLMQVKTTANDAIAIITGIVEEMEAKLPEYDARFEAMQTTLNTHDTVLKQIIATMQEHTERILALEEKVSGIVPITALTQEEFDALGTPNEGTLYIVTE